MLLRAGAGRRCRNWDGVTAIVHAGRRAALDLHYDAIADVLVPRSVGVGGAADGVRLRPRSDADLAFEPHEIVDVQGELWECRFDEVSDCPYYTNSSSGMSTYARPTSADEIWEMEEKAREVERRKATEAEKEKWEESWDVLAEVSYWIHADRPEEIV